MFIWKWKKLFKSVYSIYVDYNLEGMMSRCVFCMFMVVLYYKDIVLKG